MRPIVLGAAMLLVGAPMHGQSTAGSGPSWAMGNGEWASPRFDSRLPLPDSRSESVAPLFTRVSARADVDSRFPIPTSQAPQAVEDRWFAPDKVRHFFTSALLQSLGYGALRAMDVEHGSALAGASVITAGFGVGKELSDRRRGYGFSVRDLVWDAVGAAAVSVLLARTER